MAPPDQFRGHQNDHANPTGSLKVFRSPHDRLNSKKKSNCKIPGFFTAIFGRIRSAARSIRSKNHDCFHRYFFDRNFNPMENSRQEIALRLLTPGEKLLDVGCWDGHLLVTLDQAGLFQELYGVETSQPWVFAAGDTINGASLVVRADRQRPGRGNRD